MTRRYSYRSLAAAAVFGGLLLPPAHAQYYYVANAYQQPQPLYPYVQQPQAYYPYAAQPQYAPRAYPYVAPNSGARVLHRQPAPRASRRHAHPAPVRSRVDPALVEELRQRGGGKARAKSATRLPATLPKIDRTIVVREKPVVVEHRRVVDDPPIIVRREKIIDVPAPEPRAARRHAPKDEATPRVIHAEAEVTILGPDRMSIRLFRKGRGREANAKD
jgi:hypothetical protein